MGRMGLETPTRWKCVCAYDGTPFTGWQSQAGGRAIQDVIEARLEAIFGRAVRVHGSGRTDAGVHARGQVFHFDADWRHGPGKLLAAFRNGLPREIQVVSARPVAAKFHARFDATRKRYTYHLRLGDADPFARVTSWSCYRPLNLKAMQSAAAVLGGRHDFRAFTALNGPRLEDTVRTLLRLDVIKRGRDIRIVAEADGFLFRMVRSLVGVLVSVGEGRLTVRDVQRILVSKERVPAVQTAPARGLFLDRVWYQKRRGARAAS
jgi:tRNA pseudouridine38-40 synthase